MTTTLSRPRCTHIVQGEQAILSDPEAVLSTLLGSCVAACLRDPAAGVGGMNHFLLPGTRFASGPDVDAGSERFGVHAMELLVNGLLSRGALRSRLEAKLFGGARMMKGLTDVGELNATFAERFLRAEGIPIVGGSLRGDQGRRIQFWPVSGRARQIMLNSGVTMTLHRKLPEADAKPTSDGTLELF